MGDIIIEESNYRSCAFMLAHIFMLIAAISIVIYGVVKHRTGFIVSGLLAAIIFIIGFIATTAKFIKVKVLLTITRDGIIDGSTINGIGFISFEDIKEFRIVDMYNKRVIAVIPKNIDGFLSKLPIVKRTQVKRNISMDQPPVAINVHIAKDMEPEDILSLLQKRLVDYKRLFE